ncbi:hypothetical protein AA313_de0209205 [Arthrobotrys entomopaga]|nr:hypothetical protein AA313_de0209205 [Arthrobotrys entomopaga]
MQEVQRKLTENRLFNFSLKGIMISGTMTTQVAILKLQEAVARTAFLGAIWVGDTNHEFDTHRFCEPGMAKNHIDDSIWFWDIGSPGVGKEGADNEFFTSDFQLQSDIYEVLREVNLVGDAKVLTANMLQPDAHPEWAGMGASEIFQNFVIPKIHEKFDDPVYADEITDGIYRIFHPKLGGLQHAKAYNLRAIQAHGNIIDAFDDA